MMKYYWYVIGLSFLIFSCNEKKEILKENNFAIISGTIKNHKSDRFSIIGKKINESIKVDKEGNFLDTLFIKVNTTNGIKINNTQLPIYIKNGNHLKIEVNAENVTNTITYSGEGEKENNYLLAQYKYGLKAGYVGEKGLFTLEEGVFFKKMASYKTGLDSIDQLYDKIDTELLSLTKKQNIKTLRLIKNLYKTSKESLRQQKENLKKLVKGVISPTFKNYEDREGNLISFDDYKGSYVYIDIWGTWIKNYTEKSKEINTTKQKYASKNIKFISLCADNEASSGTIRFAKEKWRLAIKNNNLSGTQLFIGNDRVFLKQYEVRFLPRAILIDPQGKIISAEAPLLYNPKINNLFNTLNLN